MIRTGLLAFSFLFFAGLNLNAQFFIGETEVDTTSVVTGLDTPWEILWGPDDHIWITERYGRVSRLDPESGTLEELAIISDVYEQSESGLLGMALHPEFESMPYVYLVYNYLEGSAIKEKLVRYTYDGEELISPEILLDNIGGAGNHNGSRLLFGDDNKLYMTTGDAVDVSTSQNLSSLNGKILRMNEDGSIPADNPFDGSYVWTLGHRNPQGLVKGPGGLIYSSEHGPNNDDEINIIEEGRNYGWPDVHGFCDGASEKSFCDANNVKEPVVAWTPTLAVAGISYYSSSLIPEWKNSLLVTTLKESEMVVLKMDESGENVVSQSTVFNNWWGRLRAVCVAPDGRVFISSSERDGRGSPASGDDRIVEIKPVDFQTSAGPSHFDRVRFFPNPVSSSVFRITGLPEDIRSLKIMDSSGRIVYRDDSLAGQQEVRIRADLESGLYILNLQSTSSSKSLRFLRL